MTYCIYKPSTNQIYEVIKDTTMEEAFRIAELKWTGVIIYGFEEDLTIVEYQKLCAIYTIEMLAELNSIEINIKE